MLSSGFVFDFSNLNSTFPHFRAFDQHFYFQPSNIKGGAQEMMLTFPSFSCQHGQGEMFSALNFSRAIFIVDNPACPNQCPNFQVSNMVSLNSTH